MMNSGSCWKRLYSVSSHTSFAEIEHIWQRWNSLCKCLYFVVV